MKVLAILCLTFLAADLTTRAYEPPSSHVLSAVSATNINTASWLAQRLTIFARWQAAHPHSEAQWLDQNARNPQPLAEKQLHGAVALRERPNPALVTLRLHRSRFPEIGGHKLSSGMNPLSSLRPNAMPAEYFGSARIAPTWSPSLREAA
jgi:hypothetical protein